MDVIQCDTRHTTGSHNSRNIKHNNIELFDDKTSRVPENCSWVIWTSFSATRNTLQEGTTVGIWSVITISCFQTGVHVFQRIAARCRNVVQYDALYFVRDIVHPICTEELKVFQHEPYAWNHAFQSADDSEAQVSFVLFIMVERLLSVVMFIDKRSNRHWDINFKLIKNISNNASDISEMF